MNTITTPVRTKPYLVQPTEQLAATWLAAMREHQAVDGAPDAGGLSLTDLESGDCLVHYTEGLREGTCMRPGTQPLEGCEWWLVEPDDHGVLVYLGRASFRRHPGRRYGHLEFVVRPSQRRQGHGTRVLRLGLDIASGRGVDVARLGCVTSNDAARRLIERAGGHLEETTPGGGGCWYSVDACAEDGGVHAAACGQVGTAPFRGVCFQR